jgi:hypothetical protein
MKCKKEKQCKYSGQFFRCLVVLDFVPSLQGRETKPYKGVAGVRATHEPSLVSNPFDCPLDLASVVIIAVAVAVAVLRINGS